MNRLLPLPRSALLFSSPYAFTVILACLAGPVRSGEICCKSIVLREHIEKISLDPAVHYISDTSSTFTPATIGALSDSQWAKFPRLPLNGGYLRNPVWLRVSFIDSLKDDQVVYISLTQPQLDTVELYQLQSTGVKLLARTGRLCKRSWPGIAHRQPTFALPSSMHENNGTFFLRVRTTDVCAISLEIIEGGYFFRNSLESELMYGIYFGSLAVLAFFNLFLFFSVRFVSCLWYCLWIFCFGVFQTTVGGHWNFVNELPAWFVQCSPPVFVGGCLVFGGVFTTEFLELRKISLLVYRIFIFFECTGVLTILAAPFDNGRFAAIMATSLSGIFVLISMFAGIFSIRYQGRMAVFYTIGISSLTVGVLLNVGRNFGVLPNIFLTAKGNLIGSIIEMTILAFALIDRIASIEREKAIARERAQTSEKLATESRLRALQVQMNPHFLFNTLNTIAEMISAYSKKAEQLVINLSKLFRYTLASSERKNVTLAEELEMIKTYLAIEKERFGKRLEYSIDVQGDPSKINTLGLILQPIVENAIKHGIGPKAAGGQIKVFCRIENQKTYIKVSDTGCGFGNSPNKDGTGHGLKNIKERLNIVYGESAKLSCSNEDGAVVEIELPDRKPE
jgi:two-component sensor histidine kinase